MRLLGLAPGGVCLAADITAHAGGLLHHLFTLTRTYVQAIRSLLHLPSGYPAWPLASTVPCGVRTFLYLCKQRQRSPGQPGQTYYREWQGIGTRYIILTQIKQSHFKMLELKPKYHLEGIFNPDQANPNDAHSILMRLIPGGSRVLELGCASGYLSGYMEQALGCRVTGLEFDPAATVIAATRCSEVYTVDLDAPDALQAAYHSAPYDVLLAAAVLEHLKYPQRLLQEAHQLLKPDGIIIVSLPNIAHWSIRLKLLRGIFDYEDYGIMDRTHLALYTLKTGRGLIEAQGYNVEETHIAGSGLQNLLHNITRRTGQKHIPLILPGLLAYELIYLAKSP